MFRTFMSLLILLFSLSPVLANEINLEFKTTDKYFVSNNFVDSAEYDTYIIYIESQKPGLGKLFWLNSYMENFHPAASLSFSIKQGKHKYYFNVPSQNSNWLGYIKSSLIYPQIEPDRLKIKEAKLVQGNLLTKIASGWQEFWGPKGRAVIGSTINTMQSPTLFGQAIFVYIYIILLIALIITKGRGFKIILLMWLFLELSSSYSNWLEVKKDFKYFGKSLTEKRRIANTSDFYDFILFCKENIPQDSNYDQIIPPIYNDIKARYYLYPRKLKEGAEFLIVYDKEPTKEQLGGYYLLKEFRKGAYIYTHDFY